MQLKGKVIFNINKVLTFATNPYGYFKPFASGLLNALPAPARTKIRNNRALRSFAQHTIRPVLQTFRPLRTPRVFVKSGIGIMDFFQVLHDRKIEYVLLRWWQELPSMPPGEDLDILISDDHRLLIEDLITYKDNGGIKCDIYTVSGANNGSRRNLPYFQAVLAHTLLNTRVLYRGAYVPAERPYFASLAYHALFHKGCSSGLTGFAEQLPGVEHNYTAILSEMAERLAISIDISVQGIYSWLKEENYAPADDTLTKLVEHRPELSILEKRLYSDARGGELMVYVIREQILKDGLIDDFRKFLEKDFQLDVLDLKLLAPEEKALCKLHIRGGKWDKGPFRYSGGPPCALLVAYDYHPKPLRNREQQKQVRMTNRHNYLSKYNYRDRIKSLFLLKGDYNGIHSADNEMDAWAYISILGKEYRNQIEEQVEKRRVRFARKWGVLELLFKNAATKVELIDYHGKLAVKKTFRYGKERHFERELYAAKELSNELRFIPPLLEEGDYYLVTPYLPNLLDNLPESDCIGLLKSKRENILQVILALYSRGFALVNFTPDSIIITPDYKFYCTGFEYLYRYATPPSALDAAYEVAGLPQSFQGDYPEGLDVKASSFNAVWAPYIGLWEKQPIRVEQLTA